MTTQIIVDRASKGDIERYISLSRKTPLLSREQEIELGSIIQDPSASTAQRLEAQHRMVEANLRLVVKVAYTFHRAQFSLMDLIQEGNIGLMEAAKKYDPTRANKFSTYAIWWIKAYIYKFVIGNDRLVRIGTTIAQRRLFFQMNGFVSKCQAQGIDPTNEMIAKNFGCKPAEVEYMRLRMAERQLSTSAPLDAGDGETMRNNYEEALVSDRTESPVEDRLVGEHLQRQLSRLLIEFATTLLPRERLVFEARTMKDEDPSTLQELGLRYGVSRERMRQVENQVVEKLKGFLSQKLGKDFNVGLLHN
jgi:RNA polymerase sigma-32 factor